VSLSLVVAGLGGSRSEKRAVGLSGKGGWLWLSAGGGGGKKKKKKKKKKKIPTPWLSAGGFRWWLLRKQKEKFSPSPFRAEIFSPINHHASVSNRNRSPTRFLLQQKMKRAQRSEIVLQPKTKRAQREEREQNEEREKIS
jgi:hypothetical protein